ncbi:MAG: hypothetical protein WCJ01_09885 [Ignavibacteria bacterium]
MDLCYGISDEIINLSSVQIEIDLTIEFKGAVCIFEAKNGLPDSFNVLQIYHPYLYYTHAKSLSDYSGRIKDIFAVYVVRNPNNNNLSFWRYTFTEPYNITSIKLTKSSVYVLNN